MCSAAVWCNIGKGIYIKYIFCVYILNTSSSHVSFNDFDSETFFPVKKKTLPHPYVRMRVAEGLQFCSSTFSFILFVYGRTVVLHCGNFILLGSSNVLQKKWNATECLWNRVRIFGSSYIKNWVKHIHRTPYEMCYWMLIETADVSCKNLNNSTMDECLSLIINSCGGLIPQPFLLEFLFNTVL